jgi:hypothetical protein
VWSGADYNNPPEDLTYSSGVQYGRSGGYHINGDYSLRVIFGGSAWAWINICSTDNVENETFNIRLKMYNNSQPVTVRLIEVPNHFVDTVVPVSDRIQTINMSLTTNSESQVKLQINTSNESTVYIDDVIVRKNLTVG